jgi:hypothetical protein
MFPRFLRVSALALLLSLVGFRPLLVQATPAFARQVNLQCTACHIEFPILNDFGRSFKLGGYTMSAEQTQLPPIAFMLQPGFTHTQNGIPGGAAPGFKDNDNFALGTASIFYSGRLFGPYANSLFGENAGAVLNKIGVFYQHTYDGVAKSWNWDNVELRYADTVKIFGKSAAAGFYLNNNPTLQDPWNTLSAWGFPFNSSPLAPTPAAATLIDGGLSQQVIGAGAYAYIEETVYLDVGMYHTLGSGFQNFMGIDPTDETQVPGLAPYWRAAYTRHNEERTYSWMIGTSGMVAETYPTRISSSGKDQIVDIGFDTQYQTTMGNNDILAMVSWTHENQRWDASQALGLSSNATDDLWHAAATLHVLHDKTYGAAIQYFIVDGSPDALLYGGSAIGSPQSDGVILEANWLPINKSGGPKFWPRSNLKLSVQYVIYNRFNGGRSNYDGLGSNAHGNNTLFLSAWLAF